MTSRPALLWDNSPLVVPGRAGLTTRPGPSSTCFAGVPRTIKETFVAATDYRYPYMG